MKKNEKNEQIKPNNEKRGPKVPFAVQLEKQVYLKLADECKIRKMRPEKILEEIIEIYFVEQSEKK